MDILCISWLLSGTLFVAVATRKDDYHLVNQIQLSCATVPLLVPHVHFQGSDQSKDKLRKDLSDHMPWRSSPFT